MQTYCFIGADKNVGKTTAFNFVYDTMQKRVPRPAICVTSIGINGEEVDTYDATAKPAIWLHPGTVFLTHGRHLYAHTGKYQTIATFHAPQYRGEYILGRCLTGLAMLLEGPNSARELLAIKKEIETVAGGAGVLLIDGSIDRQFLAEPQVADMLYFAVRLGGPKGVPRRTAALLQALALPPCPEDVVSIVRRLRTEATRSLLFLADGTLLYHGEQIPFTDDALRRACASVGDQRPWLYLAGALSRTLAVFLAPYRHLRLLLDNFTLCQTGFGGDMVFRPEVFLLHPVPLKAIFVRQDGPFDPALLPQGIPVINLFRSVGGVQ